MINTELKSFADELGMNCIGNDFDFHLKKFIILYKEKDADKKNQVGRNLINVKVTLGGKLIWK